MTTLQARELLVDAYRHWNEDKAPRLAAAFSFYAVLAMAPLLVIGVAGASFMLDKAEVQASIMREATRSLGRPSAELISQMIDKSAQPATGIFAAVVSLAVALYGGSSLFLQLADTVNTIWGVPLQPSSVKAFVRTRLVSLLLLFGFGLVFLAWVGLDSWLAWMDRRASDMPVVQGLSQLASALFLSIVFAVSYRALPRNCVAWRDVWFGAVLAAIGFTASKYLLSLYFGYSGVAGAYGPAGALIVVLLWVYYSSQIYYFGLELVYVYAHRFGSQVERSAGGPPILQHRAA